MEILKVSARSNPNSVAGALAGVLREKGGAEINRSGSTESGGKSDCYRARIRRTGRDRSRFGPGVYGH